MKILRKFQEKKREKMSSNITELEKLIEILLYEIIELSVIFKILMNVKSSKTKKSRKWNR